MDVLTKFALKNTRVTLVFVLSIILLGVVVYLDYPRREDPSITIREAIVTAAYPGMAPARVEDLITKPIERAIREIPEVDEIRSDSKTGVSVLHVAIRDDVADLETVWTDLRNKMADIAGELPSGTQGPSVDDEVGLTAVATVVLWSDGFTLKEMEDAADDVKERLQTLDGVKKIELFGAQEERVFLEVSNARLAEYGVSPLVIIDTLQDQNIISPGGVVDAAGVNIVIEPSGAFESIDDLRSVIFTVPATGEVASLADIAEIRRDFVDPPDEPMFYDGRPALALSVSIADGVNAVEFGDRLTARIAEVQNTLPLGLVLEYATFQPDLVEASVANAVNNVYQTLAIVLIVVMVFLGPRTGLIVGAIVPLAMLLAVIVMRLLEIELQRVSIAAMIISLGLLVDNGIVVAEDIRSRLEAGEDRSAAAVAAGRSLAIPLLTSSLTTILAFLPMYLSVGSAGEYTKSLSQVIIIVLLGSWVLAMTVTPAMSAWFMRVKPAKASKSKAEPTRSGGYRIYRGLLRGVLHVRVPFLALMVAGLVGSGLLFKLVPQEFFPGSDRNQFLIYVDLPAGTSVNETQRVVRGISAWLADEDENPDLLSNAAYVGSGGPRFFLSLSPLDPDPHLGFVVVNTADAASVPAAVDRTRRFIAEAYPEARGRVKPMWLGSTEAGLVEVRLTGVDAESLYANARRVEAAFRAVPGTLNVENDWENKVLKLRIVVDQARARRAGVTSEEIAGSLATFLNGAEITDYREGDDIIPIELRGVEAERNSLAELPFLEVYSSSQDVNVSLSQIATIEPEFQFGRIKRLDEVRTVTIRGLHPLLKAGDLAARLEPALAELELAPGEQWSWGGELESSAEAQANLFRTMPLCFAAIVALLIWQFNSFRRALIIVLTIPLAFIGAVVGLIVMQASFGFMAILGVLSLAGIIINNGIVLIDRIDEERRAGKSVTDAIVDASAARLRPIAMTTITTVLGLLPLILFGGALWYGMANVIAYGLAVGTVLTLGVVPVLYSLAFPERRARTAPARAAAQPA